MAGDNAEGVTCGGLMIAENSVMPYMPRFEIEKVPPVNSCGFSFPAFACMGTQVSSMLSEKLLYLTGPVY